MKPFQVLLLPFLFFFIVSCANETVKSDDLEYKGAPLHPQPLFEVFPDEKIYKFSQITNALLRQNLNSQIHEIIAKQEITGLSMTMLIPEKGMWHLDTGFVSKPQNRVVDSSTVFYWASVSKVVTSTVIHQMIREDKLAMTDALSTWFPQLEASQNITINHLLNHTSGLYSFNSDSTFQFENKFHTPEELLEIASSYTNLFQPGEHWAYSNTGYLLLALIAEKIDGKSFDKIVEERITEPQNFSSMKILQPQEQPNNLALAHHQNEIVKTHFSMPLGAGNLVSDSKDMALFFYSLLTGKYLPLDVIHEMLKELYPMFDNGQYYGNGLMLYEFKEINNHPNQWIGHSGGTENYKAILVYDFETQAICAIAVNQNVPVEAVALRMMGVLKQK